MLVLIGVVLIALAIALMKLFHLKVIPILAIVMAVVMLGVSLFVTQVPTGFTGVLTTFGKVEENITLDAGINFKMPWQKIVTLDNREQRSNFAFNAFNVSCGNT